MPKKYHDTRVVRLMALADRAKSYRQLDLANAIFAELIDHYFLWWSNKVPSEGSPPEVWVEWETEDRGGSSPSEAHYDILVIGVYSSSGAVYLNCPVPLLSLLTAISALKSAEKVERGDHGKEYKEVSPKEEVNELWNELFDIVPEEEIIYKIQRHLSHDACVGIMKKMGNTRASIAGRML